MMLKKNFFVLFLLIFIFSCTGYSAEKQPVWTWASDNPITDVEVSDDSLNITASYGRYVKFWYNDSSTPYRTKMVDSGINSMKMSSDGEYVIAGELSDYTLTLFEGGTKEWEKNDFLIELRDIDFSSSGSNITAIDVYNIYFIKKSSKNVIWAVNHPTTEMSAVAMSPDGRFIAAGTIDGEVFVYSTSNSSDVWSHTSVLDGRITAIHFSGDSSHLIIGTQYGRVHVYESNRDNEDPAIIYYEQPDDISCVSAGPSSDYYLFGTNGGDIVLLSKDSGGTKVWQKSLDREIDGTTVTSCIFNGNGNYVLAGADESRLVVLVNTTTGDLLWDSIAFGKVSSVAMSFRGSNIVVGTDDGIALYYEELLDNQAPIVSIESITPSISLPGSLVTMNGSAIDFDGSVVSYRWYSSIDGNLSTDINFTISSLSQGLHKIFFQAEDNEGKWSPPVVMEIGVGDFPDASIDSVTGCDFTVDCVISEGTEITFTGSAVSSASEDTEILGYEWRSSLDNETILSDQDSFSILSLSRGLHTISFRAINEFEFWSSNVTVNVMINGIPQATIISADINPVIPGQKINLVANATDPEGEPLNYIWTSDTLFFSNEQKIYENFHPYNPDVSINGSRVITSTTDMGSHIITLRVQDSYGVYSKISNFTITILSPPTLSVQCDDTGFVGETFLFTTFADDADGIILSYEWDFDSKEGLIDSVDFEGSGLATHTYNQTIPGLDYLVVVRVTDNDGLTSYDTCQQTVEEDQIGDVSKDSSSGGGSISEIASPSVIGGILLVVIIVGGGLFYMMRDNDDYLYSSPSLSKTSSRADYMSSIEPEVSPVKERRILDNEMIDTTVVECPECSAQIDVPSVSGSQALQCPDCGLEGEIEL